MKYNSYTFLNKGRKRNMKKLLIILTIISFNILLTGCGKSLTERVIQKETDVKVGTTINLESLFTCEDGITIGFSNANTFDSNKIGSYSLDATITDGEKEVKKTYIVKVYDDEPPQITIKDNNITIYENDTFDAKSSVECSDNSGEVIEVNVDDSAVDTTKSGEYSIKYTASDSSQNTAEATTKVTVKPSFTYKKLKTLLEEIMKSNNYDKLKMTPYKNDKYVEVSFNKMMSADTTKNYLSATYVSIIFSVKDKRIIPKMYMLSGASDMSKYLTPQSLRIESKNGAISSDEKSVEYNYDFEYNYSFESIMEFYINNLDSINKLYDIANGKNLTVTTYTNKRTLKHTCSKSEQQKMKQLANLYKKVLEYM